MCYPIVVSWYSCGFNVIASLFTTFFWDKIKDTHRSLKYQSYSVHKKSNSLIVTSFFRIVGLNFYPYKHFLLLDFQH